MAIDLAALRRVANEGQAVWPDDLHTLLDIAESAQAYRHACQMWDDAMDAGDAGALDLLDDEIPVIRQRMWDVLARLAGHDERSATDG